MDQLTVLIPTFRRPEFLRECYSSALMAGVINVIISITEPDDREERALEEMLQGAAINVSVVRQSTDRGFNYTMFDGAHHIKTKLVTILTDDDYFLPDAASILLDCHNRLAADSSLGFAVWDAIHIPGGGRIESIGSGVPTGRYETKFMLYGRILTPGSLGLSPIVGMFRTDDLQDSLAEAEREFATPEFHSRPGMMVGNDLLIWMNACSRHASFYRDSGVASVCRGHDGSETTVRGYGLSPHYEAARRYFVSREAAKSSEAREPSQS